MEVAARTDHHEAHRIGLAAHVARARGLSLVERREVVCREAQQDVPLGAVAPGARARPARPAQVVVAVVAVVQLHARALAARVAHEAPAVARPAVAQLRQHHRGQNVPFWAVQHLFIVPQCGLKKTCVNDVEKEKQQTGGGAVIPSLRSFSQLTNNTKTTVDCFEKKKMKKEKMKKGMKGMKGSFPSKRPTITNNHEQP